MATGAETPERVSVGSVPVRQDLIVVFVAALIFIGCMISPPSLMDDVDAVQASIARTMLVTGDWVTAHLDGVTYFEKPPLKYWLIATSFKIFGVHDMAARLPLAVITVLLCLLTARIGRWAFGAQAGFYAGLCLSTCVGLFLFTRILIADVALTFTITLAVWAFLRAMDDDELHPRLWGLLFWVSAGAGLLFKGLISAVFVFAAGGLYLLFTCELLRRESWRRLTPFTGGLLFLLIAAPWHIMAAIRNPPVWYFSMYSGPGQYHGFFWFYFFNEHILRFLNRRFPHDYNTVPRLSFWLFHLLWLFPWSVYFPSLFRLKYQGADRAERTRLMCLCLIGFLIVFFSFSSTQEYYSMPAYPAIALLLGCALATENKAAKRSLQWSERALLIISGVCAAAIVFLLIRVWNLATPGDIAQALRQQDANAYTLSLGHMGDLTLASFAYLRSPLTIALIAFVVGCLSLVRATRYRVLGIAAMMVLFFHAARLAMVTFDPYLSSKPLADALLASPPGELIADDQYYTFSSVFFYADRQAYLLNGRVNNLEYGSNAPDAPRVFISNQDLASKWASDHRFYLLVEQPSLGKIEGIVGPGHYTVVKESGGKLLLTNRAIT